LSVFFSANCERGRKSGEWKAKDIRIRVLLLIRVAFDCSFVLRVDAWVIVAVFPFVTHSIRFLLLLLLFLLSFFLELAPVFSFSSSLLAVDTTLKAVALLQSSTYVTLLGRVTYVAVTFLVCIILQRCDIVKREEGARYAKLPSCGMVVFCPSSHPPFFPFAANRTCRVACLITRPVFTLVSCSLSA
jgi:hypothetical protein